MLNVSTFGNTADIYAIVRLVPHACQHITVDRSHSSCDTVAKIWGLAGSGGTKTASFTNPPRRKNRTGLNPVTGVATALTRHLFFLCVLSTFVASFDWDTLARLCSGPESRLIERCNNYCLHSTVASASFLTCLTDLWITLYKQPTRCNNNKFFIDNYNQLNMFRAIRIPPRSCHQQAVSPVHYNTSRKHSLVLLRMGEIIARNMLSWL